MSNARYVSKYRSALLVIKTTPMVEYTSLIGSGELYGSPRYERVKTRHETHKSSVRAVKAFLESRGVSHACVERQALRAESIRGHDLIIALGGDGTTLISAHRARDVDAPVLGINTDPATKDELTRMYMTKAPLDERRSTGHLCAANRFDAERVLDAVAKGSVPGSVQERPGFFGPSGRVPGRRTIDQRRLLMRM